MRRTLRSACHTWTSYSLFPCERPITRIVFHQYEIVLAEKGWWEVCLIVPEEGQKKLLDMLVGATGFTGVRLRLYKNNYTPVAGSVYSSFTEADFSGYAGVTPSFSAATIVNGKGNIQDSAARDFTHNGGGTANTVYGYYVVESGSTKILWAERFPSPLLMSVGGDKITITLSFSMGSAN